MLKFLRLELLGLHGKHLRYCADMIYSGHTYFIALFALGAYDAFRSFSHGFSMPCRQRSRIIVGIMLLTVVSSDVVLILLNRFHYTLDVVLALLFVVLCY